MEWGLTPGTDCQGYYSVTELCEPFNDDGRYSVKRLAAEDTWDGKWTAKCMTWYDLNLGSAQQKTKMFIA